jgi:hypothetical protein
MGAESNSQPETRQAVATAIRRGRASFLIHRLRMAMGPAMPEGDGKIETRASEQV